MQFNEILSLSAFSESPLAKVFEDAPIRFVDVGARGGVHELVAPIAGCTEVLAFEAEPEEAERLSKELNDPDSPWRNVVVQPVALAADNGSKTLYETTAPTNSSLRPTNDVYVDRYNLEKWKVASEFPLETQSLDNVLDKMRQTDWGDFIKIDTQGTEYEILEGARKTLQNASLVVCEVSFLELYVGQKLFSDIEILLRDQGLHFYGWGREDRRSTNRIDKTASLVKERMWQADAFFIRDPFSSGATLDLSDRDVAKLIMAGIVTSFFDFALECAERCRPEWAPKVRSLVSQCAACDLKAMAQELAQFASAAKHDDKANVARGKLVDKFREYADYKNFDFDVPHLEKDTK